jgi:TPP-dependent pyruvate/acetoin dehydrogenase alpha subunit
MNKIELIKALKKIIQIRCVEENILEDFKKNNISSFIHFCSGQEAIAVGVGMSVSKKDIFFGNHRSHGHYLAKNGNFSKMIYEIYGDARGCCDGYGGSMHMLDLKVGFAGSSPILGSGPPIASGMAFAQKLKKKNNNNITVVFLGDGASEEGSFYETLNLSGLLKLPILYVIENNLYAGETSSKFRKTENYSLKNIAKHGFGLFYEEVNGQDVVDVFNKASLIKKKILKYAKPGILHAKTLRRNAHSGIKFDLDSEYRINDTKKMHFENDPIKLIIKKLSKIGIKNDLIKKYVSDFESYENKKFKKIRNTIKIKNNE